MIGLRLRKEELQCCFLDIESIKPRQTVALSRYLLTIGNVGLGVKDHYGLEIGNYRSSLKVKSLQ